MSDDLSKKEQDKYFVNCHQDYEKNQLKQQGHSEEAIQHCCNQDLANNPRDEFVQCLIDFDDKEK